jgi:hypothetical protein
MDNAAGDGTVSEKYASLAFLAVKLSIFFASFVA